jgi:hypothetical protein
LTIHTRMWHEALIHFHWTVCTVSTVLSVLYLFCKSVLKMDNYTFQEYTDMHLILSEAAVRMNKEGNLNRHFWTHMFHVINYDKRETDTICCSTVAHKRQKKCTNNLCGRAHNETCRGESPHQHLWSTNSQNSGMRDSVAGSPCHLQQIQVTGSLDYAHKNFTNDSFDDMVKIQPLAATYSLAMICITCTSGVT